MVKNTELTFIGNTRIVIQSGNSFQKFTGKIIEEIDFNKPGTYAVRAKGNFDLHGIVINKIIHATLTIINGKQLKIESDFSFSLTEFSIKVPRLVHRKVAENIEIHVGIRMNK